MHYGTYVAFRCQVSLLYMYIYAQFFFMMRGVSIIESNAHKARLWRLCILVLVVVVLIPTTMHTMAESADAQDAADNTGNVEYSAEELAALFATSHPELTDKPEIGTWYRITPEGALSSDGTQWHGLFRKGNENKVIVYFYGGGVSIDNHSAANPDEFYSANSLVDGLENLGIGFPAEVNPFYDALPFCDSTAGQFCSDVYLFAVAIL